MVYHFGFVLYEQNDIMFFLSVCKGKLKIYYYKGELSSQKDSVKVGDEFPLMNFSWDEFENKKYVSGRSYPQMSFVFFGVKSNSKVNEDDKTVDPQAQERDTDVEVMVLAQDIVVHKVSEHCSDVKYCGVNYRDICFSYSKIDNRCGVFYHDEWQNRYFSDIELSWCKLYCINKEEVDTYREIHNLYQTIFDSPQIVENTDIEEILSHLYVEYENGTISRPGKDDIEYSNKITKLDARADCWLIKYLEVGRIKTNYSKWKLIADYTSSHKDLKGQELINYRSEIVKSYSKKKHLDGLLRYQTGAIDKCLNTLKQLNEFRTNELLKYGNIKKYDYSGLRDVIRTSIAYKEEFITQIAMTVHKINREIEMLILLNTWK